MWQKWLLVSGLPDSITVFSETVWTNSFPEIFTINILLKWNFDMRFIEEGKWWNHILLFQITRASGFHLRNSPFVSKLSTRKRCRGTDGKAGVKMPPHRVHSSSLSKITRVCFHFQHLTSDHFLVFSSLHLTGVWRTSAFLSHPKLAQNSAVYDKLNHFRKAWTKVLCSPDVLEDN